MDNNQNINGNNVSQNQSNQNTTTQEDNSSRLDELSQKRSTIKFLGTKNTLTEHLEQLLFIKKTHTEIDNLSVLPIKTEFKKLNLKYFNEFLDQAIEHLAYYISEKETHFEDTINDNSIDIDPKTRIKTLKEALNNLNDLIKETDNCIKLYAHDKNFNTKANGMYITHATFLIKKEKYIQNMIIDLERKNKDNKEQPNAGKNINLFGHDINEHEIKIIYFFIAVAALLILLDHTIDRMTTPVTAQHINTDIATNNTIDNQKDIAKA